MNSKIENKQEENGGRQGVVTGMVLVTIGLLLLVGQFVNINIGPQAGMLVLPLIGGVFMLVGIIGRTAGFMIPGGIIGGIGLGAILNENTFGWGFVPTIDEGALFMFGSALGWASITLFSALFSDETQWWALILAAIFALIGLGVGYGGIFMSLVTLLGQLWPLAVIIAGGAILLRAWRNRMV